MMLENRSIARNQQPQSLVARFLGDKLKRHEVAELLEQAKDAANKFLSENELEGETAGTGRADARISQQEMAEMQKWYTEGGREVMADFVKKLSGLLATSPLRGHPGHDRRHILIQDLLAALGFIGQTVEGENIDGARCLFLLSALFHDFGRLIEPALGDRDPSLENHASKEHAKLGFLALKDFLESDVQVNIPETVKKHLLFAVLVHAEVANYPGHIFAHLTQAADRMQIYGAEGLLRFLASDMGVKGIPLFPSKYESIDPKEPVSYGNSEDKSIVGHLWYFVLEGKSFPGRQELLKVSARILYLMVQGTELESDMFADNPSDKVASKFELVEILEQAKKEPTGALQEKILELTDVHADSLLALLAITFVSAPGATLLKDVKIREGVAEDRFLAGLHRTFGKEKQNLKDAIIYALAVRSIEPTADPSNFLEHEDPLVRAIAKLVKNAIDQG